jgi:hypothetical protein
MGIAKSVRKPAKKAATGMVIRFHQKRLSKLTLGAGAFAYSGSSTNYPADPKNPTLVGLGGWYNSFTIIAFPIAASYKFGDHLSIGLACDFATATWQWSRAIFTAPEMATVNGMPVVEYPPATASAPKYGVGVHAGGYYHFDFGLGLGLMVKSPIWFQSINYNTTTLVSDALHLGHRQAGIRLRSLFDQGRSLGASDGRLSAHVGRMVLPVGLRTQQDQRRERDPEVEWSGSRRRRR